MSRLRASTGSKPPSPPCASTFGPAWLGGAVALVWRAPAATAADDLRLTVTHGR